MNKPVSVCLLAALIQISANLAYANSYLEMLTTPPSGNIEEQNPNLETSPAPTVIKREIIIPANLIADSHKTLTSAPVVTSPYPKYQAWLNAKARENEFDNTTDQLQNLIYTIEVGLVGLGIYEIYRYK